VKKKFTDFCKRVKISIQNFSLTEKVLFGFFILILIGSLFSTLLKVNASYLTEVPQHGGTLKEGLVGKPRFINPVIAISDTDRDLASLVYSGLLKVNSKGEIVEDLARDYSISEDGLVYSLKIRDDAFFHDGKPVTVDDLIFTIQKTQDPAIKSPKRPNWDGVIIERINDKEINFVLSQPYSPFIYNLTFGILPKHIWEGISSDEFAFSKYNLEPVGSGPYVIDNIDKDGDGIVKKYTLKSYKKYVLGEPFISKIIFNFYKNEDELISGINKNNIDSSHSISPNKIEEIKEKDKKITTAPFSRVFALYLNQGESDVLANKTVRKALNMVAPRSKVVENILDGFAQPIQSPVPQNLSEEKEIPSGTIEEARQLLLDNGWEPNENGTLVKETDDSILTLRFSISTANVEELVSVTEKIAETWRQLGAEINIKIFEPNDLTLNVIRPREFESIFFGQIVNRDLDFYAFWHSSQRSDPGLNIAGFANIDADAALEDLRTSSDFDSRKEALQNFEKEVINDLPAIFLYSPDFIYVTSDELNLEVPNIVVTSSDRFADIEKWYMETELVWRIFAN
jgi:peptide/nickel transport system substrate-binding protein